MEKEIDRYERFKCPLAVHLFFIKENKLLLLKRKNQSFSGKFGLPSGHVDGNESFIDAMIRETKEEVGIELTKNDLTLGTVYHSNFGGNEYVQVFYICKDNPQQPQNCEPDNCELIDFYDLDNLPEETLGLVINALAAIKENKIFAEDKFPFY